MFNRSQVEWNRNIVRTNRSTDNEKVEITAFDELIVKISLYYDDTLAGVTDDPKKHLVVIAFENTHRLGEEFKGIEIPTIECPHDTYSYSNLLQSVTGRLNNVDW